VLCLHAACPVHKVEEKSSTTFSFSLSPVFLSFLREEFYPFLYGKFQNKEQNTFSFSLRVFSVFSEKVFSFLLHLVHAAIELKPCIVSHERGSRGFVSYTYIDNFSIDQHTVAGGSLFGRACKRLNALYNQYCFLYQYGKVPDKRKKLLRGTLNASSIFGE
jgi:hypothetical protein